MLGSWEPVRGLVSLWHCGGNSINRTLNRSQQMFKSFLNAHAHKERFMNASMYKNKQSFTIFITGVRNEVICSDGIMPKLTVQGRDNSR